MPRRSPNWGGARDNRSALARPTVKRIELDDDVATIVRNACVIRHGTATKADVTEYVNDLIRRSKAMATANYTYTLIAVDALVSTDLRTEAALDTTAEAYRITFYSADGFQRSDTAEALYLPSEGRLGVAWGADATWADVKSLESGIRLWATDPDGWERAN